MADFSGLKLLVFRVTDLLCATEVHGVREILDAQPVTRIPGAAGAVDGLMNVRGDLVTVVDGARLLGREAAPGGTILLLGRGTRQVGLVVHDVLDLATVPYEALARRETLPGVDPALVRAVGRHDGQAFVLLDLDALLDPILTT